MYDDESSEAYAHTGISDFRGGADGGAGLQLGSAGVSAFQAVHGDIPDHALCLSGNHYHHDCGVHCEYFQLFRDDDDEDDEEDEEEFQTEENELTEEEIHTFSE